MRIGQLLENIKNDNFNMEQELQVKKYLPMEEKKLIAKGIMYECTENTDGFIKVDSVQQYLSYIKFMIKHHTNLEYRYEDYDVLCSTEYNGDTLINSIINCFEADAKECTRIMKLTIDDYLQNNSLAAQVGSVVLGINNLLSLIESKVDGFDIGSILPDGLDTNRLNTFLTNYVK